MTNAHEYETKVWAILGSVTEGKKISLKWDTIPEAKLHKAKISQIQKELRLVKKDVGLTKKALNAAYTTEKTKVGRGLGAGLTAGLLGKKVLGRANAANRDSIRRNQLSAVAPYENVSRLIDSVIVQLDQIKLQLDTWIVSNS